MKCNGAHQNAKSPSEPPLCGPSVSEQAPASSNRPATILASGTVVLVLVTVSLCLGELVVQAVHLLRTDYPSIERMKDRVGLITSDPSFGRHATENDGDVLTEITISGARRQIRRPPQSFHVHGNLQSAKPNLSVIGNSFTQATPASDIDP
jgi:hypothetical protein